MKKPRDALSYPARYTIEKYGEMYRHVNGSAVAPLWQWLVTNNEAEFRRMYFDKVIVRV